MLWHFYSFHGKKSWIRGFQHKSVSKTIDLPESRRCQNVHLVPKIVCRYRVLHAPIIPNLNCISMKITYFCNFLLVPPALIRIYWEIWKKMLCFVTLDCFTNILTIFVCSHWVTPGDWASQKELKKNKLLNPIKSKNKVLWKISENLWK